MSSNPVCSDPEIASTLSDTFKDNYKLYYLSFSGKQDLFAVIFHNFTTTSQRVLHKFGEQKQLKVNARHVLRTQNVDCFAKTGVQDL